MSSLKKKTINGFKWHTIEQSSVSLLQFILGIILARILLPTDYGIIGLISVFMSIALVFINSGFGTALMQKKDRTDIDYATVFYFNLFISFICWIILTLYRHKVAKFFNEPLLALIIPVIALNLIFDALALVQRTKLTIELNFKTQAKATLFSTFISGVLGIGLAYKGYGVWALVYQSISRKCLNTIILWIVEKWQPPLKFSKYSFHQLFSFGSKILASGLLNSIYSNIYSLTIGKFFSVSELGFYNRANQFKNLPSQNITNILLRVVFPTLSNVQDNNERLLLVFQKIIKMTLYVILPIMILLIILAKPIIICSIGEKWTPSIILLQLLCIEGIMFPIDKLNLILLQVKGRSDLFLKIEVFKKIIITLTLFITFSISVKAMVIGLVIGSFIGLFLNTYYTKKIFNYGLLEQLKDFSLTLVVSLIMAISVIGITFFISNCFLKIIVGLIIGISTYVSVSYLLKHNSLNDVKDIIVHIRK